MSDARPPGTPSDDPRSPRPVPLPPRYRFEAALGEGGLGTVVKAYDTQLRVSVAIKAIRHDLANADPQRYVYLRARFEREAIAGALVRSSPYVVSVYDQLVDQAGNTFLILEFMPGGTLRDRLAGGPLPVAAALRLIADAARGLLALHEADIVHRDVKPENLFIAADGRAQVGDLGIVQMDTTFQTRQEYGSPRGHPGTPLYMAPEQEHTTGFLRAEADQYSLGAVLFETLTGRRFKAVYAAEREALLAPMPSGVAGLVRRMTAERPEDRYPGMGAVLAAIGTIDPSAPPVTAVPAWTAVTVPQARPVETWPVNLQPAPAVVERPVPGPPPPYPGRQPVSRRAVLVGIGGVVVAGGAAGTWALGHRPPVLPVTATNVPATVTPSAVPATATATRAPPTATATLAPASPTPTTLGSTITDPNNLVTLRYPPAWTASTPRQSKVEIEGPEDVAIELKGPGNLTLFLVTSDATGTPAQEIQAVRDANAKSTKFTIVNGGVSDVTIGGEPGKFTDYTVSGNVANVLWIVNHGAKQFRFVSIDTRGRKADLDPIIASATFLAASSSPATLYTADFSRWTSGTSSDGFIRRSFDTAGGEYHYTLSTDDIVSSAYNPGDQTFRDFILDVDVRRVTGPDNAEVGLTFRVQPQVPSDKGRVHYVFLIYLDGRFEFLLFNRDGTSTTIQAATATAAVNKGSATNHLTVTCKGDQIRLAINGSTVGTYTATVVAPGLVGLSVATDAKVTGIEAAFKNLRVSSVP